MLVLVPFIFPSCRNYAIINAKIESLSVKLLGNSSPASPAGGWLEKTAIIEALSNRSLASPNNRCFFSKHKEGKSYSAFPSLCDWKDWKRFAFPTFQPHKFTPSAALSTDFPSKENQNLTTDVQSGGLDNGSFWADFPAVNNKEKSAQVNRYGYLCIRIALLSLTVCPMYVQLHTTF